MEGEAYDGFLRMNNLVSGVILSGGKNSRFGSNKALAEINSARIIDNIVGKFKNIFGEVIIVTNSPDEYRYLDTRLVSDIFPGKGSLGGLYTGLYYSGNERIFVSACDMPFINVRVIELLLSFSDGCDAVVPKISGNYEPLFAVYGRKCLAVMEGLIKNNIYRIIDIYPHVRLKEVDEKSIGDIDPGLKNFININYRDDIKKLMEQGL